MPTMRNFYGIATVCLKGQKTLQSQHQTVHRFDYRQLALTHSSCMPEAGVVTTDNTGAALSSVIVGILVRRKLGQLDLLQ